MRTAASKLTAGSGSVLKAVAALLNKFVVVFMAQVYEMMLLGFGLPVFPWRPDQCLFSTATNAPFWLRPPAAGHRPEAQENKGGARGVARRGQLQPEEQVETAEEEREGAGRERSAEEAALICLQLSAWQREW